MAKPISLGTIDFTEKPLNTSNPLYTFGNALPDGVAINLSFFGVITSDGSIGADSRVLAHDSFFNVGLVELSFDQPVSSISFNLGVLDVVGSTRITVYGRNGYKVTEILNPTAHPGEPVYEPFSFDFGENAIRRVVIQSVSANSEPDNFALDDVTTWYRPESRSVALSGIDAVDGLLYGTRWNGHTVTYSFLTTGSTQPGYGDGPETFGGSMALVDSTGYLNAKQKALATSAFGTWDDLADLIFKKTNDVSKPGMMRFATADIDANAEGFFPGLDPEAGDIFIKTNKLKHGAVPGTYDYYVFMHEIGHALGLKHPHEAGLLGHIVPADEDSHEFSIMSYRAYPGQEVDGTVYNAADSFPQTPMMNDIAAIQYLYGPNFEHNAGKDTYVFDPAKSKIFETIWDGGGTDTYDCRAYRVAVEIDLRPGKWCVLDPGQLAVLKPGAEPILARGSVFNALLYDDDPRSLIERAIGGRADDRLVGNAGDNTLEGRSGADRLDGLQGDDVLEGGKADDSLHGGSGKDLLVGGAGRDVMAGGGSADRFLFESRGDTGLGAEADRIVDFVHGKDEILLAPIDARESSAADNAFDFIGKADFTGAGQLRYYRSGGNTFVSANVDNDLAPDFEIRLDGSLKLSEGDFDL